MVEIIYGLLIAGLYVLLFRFMMGDDESESSAFRRNVQMEERISKLEKNAWYEADQPIQEYRSLFSNIDPNANEVPINSVVKAIVKHLDMQIEKVAEQTTTKPMEVKVVEKPTMTGFNITGTDGLGTTWANVAPIPTPKPKRKYTKRKTK